jgi:hypothetical protein
MKIDTFLLDPIEEPEQYFADYIRSIYVPDSVRPNLSTDNWCIPINFDKLDKILEGEQE